MHWNTFVCQPTYKWGEGGTLNSTPLYHSASFVCLGDSQEFKVSVTPQRNLPLDLYILIDLSASMMEELDTLQNISTLIGRFRTLVEPLGTFRSAGAALTKKSFIS